MVIANDVYQSIRIACLSVFRRRSTCRTKRSISFNLTILFHSLKADVQFAVSLIHVSVWGSVTQFVHHNTEWWVLITELGCYYCECELACNRWRPQWYNYKVVVLCIFCMQHDAIIAGFSTSIIGPNCAIILALCKNCTKTACNNCTRNHVLTEHSFTNLNWTGLDWAQRTLPSSVQLRWGEGEWDSADAYIPSWSARRRPRSADTTLSYSRSHLLPTSTTWALSHEYVLICVHLPQPTNQPHHASILTARSSDSMGPVCSRFAVVFIVPFRHKYVAISRRICCGLLCICCGLGPNCCTA